MGFLKNYLDKISCHHQWEVHEQVNRFQFDESTMPVEVRQTLICKRCGKIKKITI